ncbi:hypothetical protein LJK88_33460 [Paenibacillus sp. P26]|nr:hypothetical protein LJK88_33460 [Paenibacillus sp. P26]
MIGRLSAQQGFEDWKDATWTSYALGPGTHGWVILLSRNDREIGYLVVHSAGKDTYALSEYGKGEFPLFSMQTLYRSLVRLELIEYSYHAERLYYGPLRPLWHITVDGADREWYLDAKTGEELPFSNGDKSPKTLPDTDSTEAFTKTDYRHKIIESGQTEPFDPYARLPWVQGKPAARPAFDDLKQRLNEGGKPVFALDLYDSSVMTPSL